MEEVRKEGVSILYKDDKISLVGDTFKLEGSLPTSELSKVYMGNKGRSVVTLTIEQKSETKPSEPVAEEKSVEEKPAAEPVKQQSEKRKITINDYIDELAEKGLSEYEIMNTEIYV